MSDLEYYTILGKVLDDACRNMAKGFGDIGLLNDVCIESRKRLLQSVKGDEPK